MKKSYGDISRQSISLQKAPDSEMVWFKDKERLFEPCEMSAHQSRLAIAKLAAYEHAE